VRLLLPADCRSGYLVSQQQLRQRLMEIEWEDHLRLWAQRRGVAEFEQWLAKEGEKEGMAVDWQDVQVRCARVSPKKAMQRQHGKRCSDVMDRDHPITGCDCVAPDRP
jgi:hypothetical protein